MMRPDHQDPDSQDNMKPWKKYCFQKFTMISCYRKDVIEMKSLEIDDMLRIRLREAGSDEEIFTYVAWIRAFNINEPIYAELCHEVLTEDVVRSLSALIYYRDLDTITLRDLIDSEGKLDLYDRMSRMEICQEAIERMEYRQPYH
ncbi:hypothetical protein Tco_0168719 [Tanacetum coccineum]